MNKPVRIKNSQFGESEVLPQSLHVWEERGWSEVKDTPRRPRGTTKRTAASKKDDSTPTQESEKK